MPVSFGLKRENWAASGAAVLLHLGALAFMGAFMPPVPRADGDPVQTVSVGIAWAEPAASPLAPDPVAHGKKPEASERKPEALAKPAPSHALRIAATQKDTHKAAPSPNPAPAPPRAAPPTAANEGSKDPSTDASKDAAPEALSESAHAGAHANPAFGSTPGRAAAGSAAPATTTATTASTPPTRDGRWLAQPVLAYPVLSQRLGERGTVVVRLLVDEQGWPRQAMVLRSSGFDRLDQAALRHIMASRFVPGRVGDQPQSMWHDAPIEFRLP